MQTCSHGIACNCGTFKVFKAKTSDYWRTFSGLMRRIDMLAQDFNFKLVNNSVKLVGSANGARWFFWKTAGDDKVCVICMGYATGGRSGYYHVTWFMPSTPHNGCRCEFIALFYDPFEAVI